MNRSKLPNWLKIKIPSAGPVLYMESIIKNYSLTTVCQSALCPNINECFKNGTATFMILGKICTRNCPFCNIKKGKPLPINSNELINITKVIKKLKLRHVVITSVNRDDLKYFGAIEFSNIIDKIRSINPNIIIEILTPDFNGDINSLNIVLKSKPNIFNHNLETVQRLHPIIKPKSNYNNSLNILKYAKEIFPKIYTKTGLMVGFGETKKEVIATIYDIKRVNCNILTIGQYLKPLNSNLEVKEYVQPNIFEYYKMEAKKIGIKHIFSGPLIRSSYNASKLISV